MPKATAKKKAQDSNRWAKPARQKEKRDQFNMEEEEDDGLFVPQSPPPLPSRVTRRPTATKGPKSQSVNTKAEDESGLGNMRYEKAQNRKTTAAKKPSKWLDDFEMQVKAQNAETDREIKSIIAHSLTLDKRFNDTFHPTLLSIMSSGLSASQGGSNNSPSLRDSAKSTLAKARHLLQDFDSNLSHLVSDDLDILSRDVEGKWELDVRHTEKILEVGRLVAEDKINAKLSGVVPVVQNPDYSDASEALFPTGDESAMLDETWARVAKDQGKIMKRMTAAISRDGA